MSNVGEPQRVVFVEPVLDPVPQREVEPAREPVPVEPDREEVPAK